MTNKYIKRINVPNVIVHNNSETEYEIQLQIISPIPDVDSGTYCCVAENEWEKIESHFIVSFNIKIGKHSKK